MFNLGTLLSIIGQIKPEELQTFLGQAGQAAQIAGSANAPIAPVPTPAPRAAIAAPALAQAAQAAAPVAAMTGTQGGGGPMSALKGLLNFGDREDGGDIRKGLLAFGAQMMQGAAPSEDPANSSLLGALGKGVQAGVGAYDGSRDAAAKRAFMSGQTDQMTRSSDPAYIAARALAGQGMVAGSNGSYDYVPGYGERLEQNRMNDLAAQAQANLAANAEYDRRQSVAYDRQLERDAISAERDAANKPLSTTAIRAMDEADESFRTGEALIRSIDEALVLNADRYYGPGAGARAGLSRVLGDSPFSDESRGVATTTYNNLISNQVIAQLKSTFGGAITEGERQYMADNIVAAVDKSPAEAEAILTRLRGETERANAYHLDKINGITDGTRYRPNSLLEGYDPDATSGGGATASPASATTNSIPMVSGPQDPAFQSLPRGSQFRLPDGRVMSKR